MSDRSIVIEIFLVKIRFLEKRMHRAGFELLEEKHQKRVKD
jgi:hypothetical protein